MTNMGEDEDAEIEAQIRRELEALDENDLEVCDIENEDSPTQTQNEDDILPDTVNEFLRMVQSRNALAEGELKECDDVLSEVPDLDDVYFNDKKLAAKIQESLGDESLGDPLELRRKVLAELEEEDMNDEKEKSRANATEEIMALDIIRPDVMEEIQAQEAAAQEKLLRWQEEQQKRDDRRQGLLAERKRDEESRQHREQQLREQKQRELDLEREKFTVEQQAMAARLQQILGEEEEHMEILQNQLQEEIRLLEIDKKKESETLLKMKKEEAQIKADRINNAAIMIQKALQENKSSKGV